MVALLDHPLAESMSASVYGDGSCAHLEGSSKKRLGISGRYGKPERERSLLVKMKSPLQKVRHWRKKGDANSLNTPAYGLYYTAVV